MNKNKFCKFLIIFKLKFTVPLKNLPEAQLVQLVASDPLQFKQELLQAVQVLLVDTPKNPAGHAAIQDLLNNLFVETEQVKQLVAATPSHVAHEASHPHVPLASITLPVYIIQRIERFILIIRLILNSNLQDKCYR